MTRRPIEQEAIDTIDAMERAVTDWEANFLESIKRHSYPLSPKQLRSLVQMAEKYLSTTIAAELRGQQRLI